MSEKIHRYNAFYKTMQGGNPAGVVFEADDLTTNEMQEIARDIGYSETAFVLESALADFKVRFFTPVSEVDLCGHATIATFHALRDYGYIEVGSYTQETKAGILSLNVKKETVFMEQNPPRFYEYVGIDDVARCFKEDDVIRRDLPIRVVSTGIKEIFVPIKDVATMHKLTPVFDEIIQLSNRYKTIGIHIFALSDEDNIDAYGRNFAPNVGINEESATGTSNGALACYFHNFVLKGKTTYQLRQGYSMDKPSEILVNLVVEYDRIKEVHVGGKAIEIISE